MQIKLIKIVTVPWRSVLKQDIITDLIFNILKLVRNSLLKLETVNNLTSAYNYYTDTS